MALSYQRQPVLQHLCLNPARPRTAQEVSGRLGNTLFVAIYWHGVKAVRGIGIDANVFVRWDTRVRVQFAKHVNDGTVGLGVQIV
jgi:hypothetical protein